MSFLVTRPPRPVPSTLPTSTSCSAAIRATTGETNFASRRPLSSSAFGAVGAAGASAAGSGAASGSGAGASSAFAAAGPSPSAPEASSASWAASWVGGSGGASASTSALSEAMTAIFVPTATVSPSWARICWTTPLAGLGTSVSTLSVEISSSDSSAEIASPSDLSHFVIVPSETETPIWGMTTSTVVPVVAIRSLVLRQLLQACHHVFDLRDESLLERRRERNGGVGRGDAAHGRVEVLEGLRGDRRRDLGAEATGERVLVEDERLRRLLDGAQHGILVPRGQRAEIEDLDRNTFALELLRGLVGCVDHRPPGDQRDVVTFAVRPCLAEGNRVALVRHLVLDAPVKVLVLEVENRVRIVDRLDEEPLRVRRRGRADDLEPGNVREARLRVLRVEGHAREAAAGREPHRDRHRRPRAVALLGRDGHQVVPGARDEVGELHLGDRAHAHDRGAGAAADDRRLGERRVDDAPGPEFLLEALRDLECPAVDADVLADDEDALVALHLGAEAIRNCLQIGLYG